MACSHSAELNALIINDESWQELSSFDAQSLLRVLTNTADDGLINYSTPMYPLADGRNLYIHQPQY